MKTSNKEFISKIDYGIKTFKKSDVQFDLSPWKMGLFEKIVLLIIICMILYATVFFPVFYKIMVLVVLLIML